MTIGDYEESLEYELDRLQDLIDKDDEYIEKLEEKNQHLEYLANQAEALKEDNHKKDQTIQQYQDYIRELVQSVESQRLLIEKLQQELRAERSGRK